MENEKDILQNEAVPETDAAEAAPEVESVEAMEETEVTENLDAAEDTSFQDALAALQAFSARYTAAAEGENTAPEETTTEVPAPAKTTYVTEDTVSFTAPVVAPMDDMGATQKFTPVSEEDMPVNESEQTPRRRKAPVRKGRPAPKKGYGLFGIPHIISTIIWLCLIVAIGVSLGRTLWVCAADLLAFGKPDKVISITIDADDSIKDIAQKLEQAGIIRYPNLFVFFADLTGKGDRVIPDTYDLNSMYDYNALLKMMSYKPANTDVVEVLVPEGYNCAQIFKLLEEKGVCTAAKLEEWAANGELKDYWFLEDLPRGTKYCLEGYLYPDTYKFYKDADPQYVLQKFLNNFDNRFTDKMYNDFIAMQKRFTQMMKKNGYSSSYAETNKLTFHKYITLASMVEEEKANSAEGYNIASVFYNRLANAKKGYYYLNCDPTVYYALGIYYDRRPLSKQDLKFDSPYNTYVSQGLPPGPISNPGSYSLYAALYPSSTAYYYFVFDPSISGHRFSKTLAEHNQWIAEIGANK